MPSTLLASFLSTSLPHPPPQPTQPPSVYPSFLPSPIPIVGVSQGMPRALYSAFPMSTIHGQHFDTSNHQLHFQLGTHGDRRRVPLPSPLHPSSLQEQRHLAVLTEPEKEEEKCVLESKQALLKKALLCCTYIFQVFLPTPAYSRVQSPKQS